MATLEPGSLVDRYVVEERIGEGGMAAVYRVRHQTLKSRHALKVLTITNEGVRKRLVQEGQVQAGLRHPNVVAVSDVLEVGGNPGLLMEYIQGPALDHWLYNYSPDLEEALTVFRGLVAGVAAAHAQGVLHRDLKPANILLHVDDRGVHPKVTDFGLAKVAQVQDERMTRTGTTMGTPKYMAPEQIRDASTVDRRADLYSLGVILYELVCGQPPYQDADVIELFTKVAAGDHPPPRSLNASLPDPVVTCIDRLLTVDPAGRPTDCAAIFELLGGTEPPAGLPFDGSPLPPSRPVPLQIGATSLPPTRPGSAVARRWVRELVTVQPTERPPPESVGESRLDIDLDTPVPAVSTVAEHGVIGGLTLVGLALIGASVLTLLVLVGGIAWWSWPTQRITTTEVEPASEPASPPEPASTPSPAEPSPSAPPRPAAPAPRPPPQPVVAPVARPKPVERSPAEPVPDPVPVVEMGRFSVQSSPGTELVQFRGEDGSIYLAGEPLPAGTYTIHARFEGANDPIPAGTAVVDGALLQVRCVSNMKRCTAR